MHQNSYEINNHNLNINLIYVFLVYDFILCVGMISLLLLNYLYRFKLYYEEILVIVSQNDDLNLNSLNNQSISDGNRTFNPLANIFCPTSSVKCVSRFNDFPNNFNLVYANLQGMLEACHLDELKNAISKSKHVSCMVVVETWLRHRVNQNKTCAINGFNFFRSDRHSRKDDRNEGGGVAIYVADGMERSFINDHGILYVDFIFLEIMTKLSKILVCGIYRTSKCNKVNTERLFEMIIETSAKYDNVIIIGDFNLDILNNTGPVKSLAVNFNIINHFCPTHNWPNAQPSLIDIAFTRSKDKVQ